MAGPTAEPEVGGTNPNIETRDGAPVLIRVPSDSEVPVVTDAPTGTCCRLLVSAEAMTGVEAG